MIQLVKLEFIYAFHSPLQLSPVTSSSFSMADFSKLQPYLKKQLQINLRWSSRYCNPDCIYDIPFSNLHHWDIPLYFQLIITDQGLPVCMFYTMTPEKVFWTEKYTTKTLRPQPLPAHYSLHRIGN